MFDKDVSQKTLKRAILQNPRGGVIVNWLAEIKSRPATLPTRSVHQGGFPVNTLKFWLLLQKDLTWAPFFNKTAGCVPQVQNFIKRPVHHRRVSQNTLFKTAFFLVHIPKRNFGKASF